jgi:hypothetical protein
MSPTTGSYWTSHSVMSTAFSCSFSCLSNLLTSFVMSWVKRILQFGIGHHLEKVAAGQDPVDGGFHPDHLGLDLLGQLLVLLRVVFQAEATAFR